jgi:hypothetical protein
MQQGQATEPRTPEGKAISALNGTTHGFCAVRISEKNTKGKEIEKGHLDKLTEAYKPRHYGEAVQIQKMATELTKGEQISEELHKMEEAGQIEEKFYGNLRRSSTEARRPARLIRCAVGQHPLAPGQRTPTTPITAH